MPFALRNQLPEEISGSYWSHNSGGEHAHKQSGEIPDINAYRIDRGDVPYKNSELLDFMRHSGVVAAHTKLTDGSVGPTVGYVVADRDTQQGITTVQDLFVDPQHRRQGLGGFLLGTLVTNMIAPRAPKPGGILTTYGKSLVLGSENYVLPDKKLELMKGITGADVVDDMKTRLTLVGWSGILEVTDDGLYEASLYVEGSEAAQFVEVAGDEADVPMYRVVGSDNLYTDVVYAAVAVLNQGKPGVLDLTQS